MTSNEKKVLMIAATPFFLDRGCHIRIYHELRCLKDRGWHVTLVTYPLGKDIPGFDVRRTIRIPWYKKTSPGASWHKIYIDFFLLVTSVKAALSIKPSIFHAHQYEGLLAAYLTKKLTLSRSPIVFDCQGSLTEEFFRYHPLGGWVGKAARLLLRRTERILLKIPNTIVCSSAHSAEVLTTQFAIPKTHITIVNDGWNDAFMRRGTEEAIRTKQKLGIAENRTVLMYTGSLTKAKGVGPFLESLPLVFEKRDDICVVCVGYGDMEAEYRKKYAYLVDSGKLIFTGRISYFDLPLYLSIADVAIDPKKESSESSAKIMEYLSFGIPTISFAVPIEELKESVTRIVSFKELPSCLANPHMLKKPMPIPTTYSWKEITAVLEREYLKLR